MNTMVLVLSVTCVAVGVSLTVAAIRMRKQSMEQQATANALFDIAKQKMDDAERVMRNAQNIADFNDSVMQSVYQRATLEFGSFINAYSRMRTRAREADKLDIS